MRKISKRESEPGLVTQFCNPIILGRLRQEDLEFRLKLQ